MKIFTFSQSVLIKCSKSVFVILFTILSFLQVKASIPSLVGPSLICGTGKTVQYAPPSGISPTGGTWSSSDVTKATVNQSGLVTSVAIGTTNIQFISSTGTICASTVTIAAAAQLIQPYGYINSFDWLPDSVYNVCVGDTVGFGPQTVNSTIDGTWSWTGPNGFTASTREITFNNIQASQIGVYTVTRTEASGCSSSKTITLVNSTSCAVSCIGNFVWNDYNRNGIQEAGEPGIAGVTVHLYTDAGVLLQGTTTNATGYYQFSNVHAGNYYLHFVTPSGYTTTLQDQGSNTALNSDVDPATGNTGVRTYAAGECYLEKDAGYYQNCASVITNYQSINQNNGAGWQSWVQSDTARVCVGGSVMFGPQALNASTWSWTGPNSYTNNIREITLSNVTAAMAGTYVVKVTNASGCISTRNMILNSSS